MLIKFSHIALVATLVVSTQNVFAANSCPNVSVADRTTRTVDLRREMGPIRDQDSVGWCYGFTAADLISHYLYKKSKTGWNPFGVTDYTKRENMVSGVGVSSIFNFDANREFFDKMPNAKDHTQLANKFYMSPSPSGGTIANALLSVQKQGICLEKDLNSENYRYVRDVRCAQKNICNIDEMLKIIYDSGNQDCCQNYSAIKQMFPTFSVEQIRTILRYSEKKNAFNRLMNLACHKPINVGLFSSSNKLEFRYYKYQPPAPPKEDKKPGKPATPPTPSTPAAPSKEFNANAKKAFMTPISGRLPEDKLADQIDASLNRGVPAGISYSPGFLTNSNAQGREGHASSIIGKYFNPRTCEVEYILRNSWGANCGSITRENPELRGCIANFKGTPAQTFARERACRAKFPPVSRNPRIKCDQATGYIFVPKKDLAAHLSGVTTLIE